MNITINNNGNHARSIYTVSMKKFLAILILILTFQTPSWADDIRDFQIEGISVGDSLLDYYSEDEIISYKTTPYKSKKWAQYANYFDNPDTYEGFMVHFKNDDSKYIIGSIEGLIIYKNNIEECYELKKTIVSNFDTTFSNIKKKSWKKKNRRTFLSRRR